MTKADLVKEVSSKCELTQSAVEEVVNVVFEKVTAALVGGDEVKLKDFGNFVVKTKAARTGTNPGTGQKIQIPASKVVKFKPAKALKDSVNN